MLWFPGSQAKECAVESIIRDMTQKDLSGVLTINQAARPAVGSLDVDGLSSLLGWCAHARVIVGGEQILGYLLAMEPGQPYASVNYRYFESSLTDHVYVDRIAVGDAHRNQGIGLALYQDLFQRVPGRPVSCEVNVVPMNAGSLRFHHRLGFESVGEQETESGKKRVCLLVRRP